MSSLLISHQLLCHVRALNLITSADQTFFKEDKGVPRYVLWTMLIFEKYSIVIKNMGSDFLVFKRVSIVHWVSDFGASYLTAL